MITLFTTKSSHLKVSIIRNDTHHKALADTEITKGGPLSSLYFLPFSLWDRAGSSKSCYGTTGLKKRVSSPQSHVEIRPIRMCASARCCFERFSVLLKRTCKDILFMVKLLLKHSTIEKSSRMTL